MTGRSRGKSGTDDGDTDANLFQRTMAEVQPLKKKRSLQSPTGPNLDFAKPRAKAAHRVTQPVKPRSRKAEPEPLSADQFSGVDRRTVERMRRGKTPIDVRLDLHGSRQDAAQAELNAFISSCAATNCRTVLVITGKGSVSEGGGVLRRRLPDWLNQPACRPHVLAFAVARPEHGGAGAFYVLLRRRRGNQR